MAGAIEPRDCEKYCQQISSKGLCGVKICDVAGSALTFYPSRDGGMADAADLKSADPKGLWGFKSPSRHQTLQFTLGVSER